MSAVTFEINSAASAHIGSIGGDCELRDVQGIVEVGNVGEMRALMVLVETCKSVVSVGMGN